MLPRRARTDASADALEQLRGLREPPRFVEGEHEVPVDFHVVDAVIPGHEPEGGYRGSEFLEDRVRILDRLRLVSAREAVPNQDFRHRRIERVL